MSKQADRMNKKESGEPQVELESQFILRLPPEPAKCLREILRSGVTSLKDRFGIRLENDVRYGEVRLDNWYLHSKVLDLPTVIESLKTIDNKSFYKTADICQIMLCKEEEEGATTTDDESPSKHKKRDPNKVDKKFLYPHGVTPPLKNVRRRRFRKTLKKKYVEAPEIEKEVKRLLRGDSDAVSVKWEVISEEEEKKSGLIHIKEEPLDTATSTQQSVDVAEHDIFGEAVSDSDEEEPHINIMELEDNSRMSADDSRISDSTSLHGTSMSESLGGGTNSGLITQFSKEMFNPRGNSTMIKTEYGHETGSYKQEYPSPVGGYKMERSPFNEPIHSPPTQMSQGEIRSRLEELGRELQDLRERRGQQEMEISNIENHALRQRFQEITDSLLQEQILKEQEYQELSELLQM